MNSAIDELIPCRVRGTVDLIVNGSYWLGNNNIPSSNLKGTLLASTISLLVLNPQILKSPDLSWRIMFGIGALLGVIIIVFRTQMPEVTIRTSRLDESPRAPDGLSRMAGSEKQRSSSPKSKIAFAGGKKSLDRNSQLQVQ